MKRKIINARVINSSPLTDDIYELIIKYPDDYKCADEVIPGQFVSLYVNSESKLLPRPISICEADRKNNTLRLVYRVVGEGTKAFTTLKEGDNIKTLAPLGNGYTLINKGVNVLLGGGIGIPPMLELAKTINDYDNTYVILGYRSNETFLKDDFMKYAKVIVASDDGSIGFHGNVVSALKDEIINNNLNPDCLYACGPVMMLKGVKSEAKELGIKAYISMEERMACGVGACLGCVCDTVSKDKHSNVNNTRICTDGPVFDAEYLDI